MRTLLIAPCEMSVYRGTRFQFKPAQECLPPLNLAVLAGALRAGGHEVRVLDLQVEAEPEAAIREAVSAWRPQLAGITFKTPVYDQVPPIAASLRRLMPEGLLVGGGVHATSYPQRCLAETDFDVVVIGEGDHTIVSLADQTPLAEIAGIAYRCENEIVVNRGTGEASPACADDSRGDLDQLAYPDWSVFELRKYAGISRLFYDAVPAGFIETSRGCPAHCVYCSKGVYGSTWRSKSPRRVVDEMQQMLDYGFREIEIVDDNFTRGPDRAVAVCEEILHRGLKFPWCCRNGLRVDQVDEEFFRIARRAGLHLVAFGLETGNPALLAKWKKGATLEAGRRAVEWAKRSGITVMGYFLIGLPGESQQSLRETIDYACSLGLDFVKYNLVIPLPGTPLHQMWKDRIKADNWSQYNFHQPARELYDHPDLDWDTLEAYLREGYRRFYMRPGYLLGQFARVVRQRRFVVSAATATRLLF